MARLRTYRPQRQIQLPMSDGSLTPTNYYEPDQLLSEQLDNKDLLLNELGIRETSWNYYRVLGFLPNPDETLRAIGKDIAEYKYLLTNPFVNGCMSSRKAGTLSLDWDIDQGKCPDKYFKIIQQIWNSWDIEGIIDELLYASFFGYQPAEVVWMKDRINGQSCIIPKSFVPKDPDWFRFSDTNELRYLTKRNMVTGEPVPQYKFIVARYHPSYERPYGRPLASTIYWPVKFVNSGFRFFTIFTEKYGMPWISMKYPLGTQAQRLQQAIDMLKNSAQDAVVATPDAFATELLNMSDKASADNYKTYIDLNHEVISISILGQNLTTKVAGGSYAAAKIHGDVRQDIIMGDKHMIELAFNTLIKWVFELNWPTVLRPLFRLIAEPKPTVQDGQMSLYLAQTAQLGLFTAEYYKNRFGLLDEEIDLANVAPLTSGAGQDNKTLGDNGQPPIMKPINEKGEVEEDDKGLVPDPNIDEATHDQTDLARNEDTYNSTIDSVKNLTRR